MWSLLFGSWAARGAHEIPFSAARRPQPDPVLVVPPAAPGGPLADVGSKATAIEA